MNRETSHSNSPGSWLRKLATWLLVAEAIYLVVLNGALQLPFTQPLINQIKPEKFSLSWERAWTWYPFRVHVTQPFANGQSRSQQWQASGDYVTGAINLLPLVARKVRILGAEAHNVNYEQRPRLKADRDYEALLPFYPDIVGREVTEASTEPLPDRKPWNVSIEGARVEGNHSLWIHQMKGTLDGVIEADLRVRSRGGPLWIDGFVDLELGPALINGDQQIWRDGLLQGQVGFDEFVPRENKGLPMLKYLWLDTTINVDMNNLAFINLFLLNLDGVRVRGKGLVDGRLAYHGGQVLEGTDLSVDAHDLRVQALDMTVLGSGDIDVFMEPESQNAMKLAFRYSDLAVQHDEDSEPMLTGDDLLLEVSGSGYVLPDPNRRRGDGRIAFSMDELAAPDLSRFQRYIPAKWPFHLRGGNGLLIGGASLGRNAFHIDLKLESDNADLAIRQYRFDTNLDAALKVSNDSVNTGGSDISGTYIDLTGAQLRKAGGERGEPWQAGFRINSGTLELVSQEARKAQNDTIDMLKLMGTSDARDLLGDSAGLMGFEANVSSLAWLGVFLSNDHPARVDGQGVLRGDVQLESGLPTVGTHVEVEAKDLGVGIMDYLARGEGRIQLDIEEGGDAPDWRARVNLSDASMGRQGEDEPGVYDVNLSLEALIEDVTFERRDDTPFRIDFKIPSAHVRDMSVFNGYLPPESPMSFAGGTADLAADIVLQRDDAKGWLRLDAAGIEARLDEQNLAGDLALDLQIVGGRPGQMEFDLSGSELSISEVRVLGEESEFDEENWWARFLLREAQTTWSEPPALDASMELLMSDSRPFAAMFRNQGGPAWLSRRMEVEDIVGEGRLSMANHRLVIPEAHAISDNIEVGMKAVMEESGNNGMIYFRYKKLNALLKVKDGKRNLDIIGAREKYEEYSIDP